MLTSYTHHTDKFSLLKRTGLCDAEFATFHTGGAHTHRTMAEWLCVHVPVRDRGEAVNQRCHGNQLFSCQHRSHVDESKLFCRPPASLRSSVVSENFLILSDGHQCERSGGKGPSEQKCTDVFTSGFSCSSGCGLGVRLGADQTVFSSWFSERWS